MTLTELYYKIQSLLPQHGNQTVYANVIIDIDPMPPIKTVYSFDGYVCIGN